MTLVIMYTMSIAIEVGSRSLCANLMFSAYIKMVPSHAARAPAAETAVDCHRALKKESSNCWYSLRAINVPKGADFVLTHETAIFMMAFARLNDIPIRP